MSLLKKLGSLNWGALEIAVILAIAIIGWAVSMEVRLSKATDVNARIKNIEELMYPMLVEWEVEQRMKKSGIRPEAGLGTRGHFPISEVPEGAHIHADGTIHRDEHPLSEQANMIGDGDEPNLIAPKVIPRAAVQEFPVLTKVEKDARKWAEEAILQGKR